MVGTAAELLEGGEMPLNAERSAHGECADRSVAGETEF